MSTNSENDFDPLDIAAWRKTASRDELLAMLDKEREACASMARSMVAALERLAANRALLVLVAHHESTRGHPLYGKLTKAAHESLPHVLGRRMRAQEAAIAAATGEQT